MKKLIHLFVINFWNAETKNYLQLVFGKIMWCFDFNLSSCSLLLFPDYFLPSIPFILSILSSTHSVRYQTHGIFSTSTSRKCEGSSQWLFSFYYPVHLRQPSHSFFAFGLNNLLLFEDFLLTSKPIRPLQSFKIFASLTFENKWANLDYIQFISICYFPSYFYGVALWIWLLQFHKFIWAKVEFIHQDISGYIFL